MKEERKYEDRFIDYCCPRCGRVNYCRRPEEGELVEDECMHCGRENRVGVAVVK